MDACLYASDLSNEERTELAPYCRAAILPGGGRHTRSGTSLMRPSICCEPALNGCCHTIIVSDVWAPPYVCMCAGRN